MLRSLYRRGQSTLAQVANKIDPPVVVLLYHRVTTLESDPQMLAVTPENFRDQIRFVRENFPVLRFEDDWDGIKELSIVITFDDGYADNALEALPILEEFDTPGTFFVSTGYIDSKSEFWWDELESIILVQKELPDEFQLRDDIYNLKWKTNSASKKEQLYTELLIIMKKVSFPKREDWLNQLRDWASIGEQQRETHSPLSVGELKMLNQCPLVTIGAHSVTHTPFSSQSLEEQREELNQSKKQLENWLNEEVNVLSYPFGGKEDYTRETLHLCKKAGFKKVAANFPGQAHRWTDHYKIPRYLVRNWHVDKFKKKLLEFSCL